MSGAGETVTTTHALRLHATAKLAGDRPDNLALGGLYHFTAGAVAAPFDPRDRPTPAHEAGVRLYGSLELADDYRLGAFADVVSAFGQLRGLAWRGPSPWRAALGLAAAH